MSITTQQPYQVLARKYRPVLLSDLRGQDALVRTLSNAISSNRIAHAFLLTGIRGVGKTTTARIIARSLNCIGEDGNGSPTITPCGVCQHCVSIREDRHPDVLEMDAASRTGVGDIREIIENSRYLPVTARYKIYIIDEVHMLSSNAFNALLKTLEEPPSHVKFIFATTEIRKIPVTILSRCQRFDLRRVESKVLQAHLKDIATKENSVLEQEALMLIAETAEGSVRDSLSLLDQAIAHHASQDGAHGQMILAKTVRAMLGIADKTALFELLEYIAAGRIAEAIEQVQALYMAGTEPVQMLEELLALVHFITCIKITPTLAENPSVPENERLRSKKLAEQLAISYLSRMWQMLLKGLGEARQAPSPLTAAEMVIIRLAYTADLPSPAAVIKQIKENPVLNNASNQVSSAVISAPAMPTPALSAPEVTTKQIGSFKELVDLFRQEKELLLYHALQNDVRLVKFTLGQLEIHPARNAPSDLKKKLELHLRAWTGMEWSVIIAADSSQPTLQQEKDNEQERIKLEAASHPVVRGVLDAFPDAALKEVRERE